MADGEGKFLDGSVDIGHLGLQLGDVLVEDFIVRGGLVGEVLSNGIDGGHQFVERRAHTSGPQDFFGDGGLGLGFGNFFLATAGGQAQAEGKSSGQGAHGRQAA